MERWKKDHRREEQRRGRKGFNLSAGAGIHHLTVRESRTQGTVISMACTSREEGAMPLALASLASIIPTWDPCFVAASSAAA